MINKKGFFFKHHFIYIGSPLFFTMPTSFLLHVFCLHVVVAFTLTLAAPYEVEQRRYYESPIMRNYFYRLLSQHYFKLQRSRFNLQIFDRSLRSADSDPDPDPVLTSYSTAELQTIANLLSQLQKNQEVRMTAEQENTIRLLLQAYASNT